MNEPSIQDQQDVAAVVADLEAREVLHTTPPDLPIPGALVRLPRGMVGEVIIWFDRNPDGDHSMSSKRVALVDLRDSVLATIDGVEMAPRQVVPEDSMTVLRNAPSPSFLKRWLTQWGAPRFTC